MYNLTPRFLLNITGNLSYNKLKITIKYAIKKIDMKYFKNIDIIILSSFFIYN